MTVVGRSAEVQQLDSLINGLGMNAGPWVVDISGDAGIGKSRLLGEACAQARRRGLTVLCGRATEYERHTPFQIFTDAFADIDPTVLDEELVAALTPLLQGVRGAGGSLSHAGLSDRFSVYRAVAGALARLGENGLVVALDDLHWADPASLELVEHLIRHPVHGPVLLLLAHRKRQTPTPLTAALTRGVDSGAVLPMALGPLGERESITALAPDLPEDDARQLHAASEGNPLYLHALLHAYRNGASLPGVTARIHPHVPDDNAAGVPNGLDSLLLDELTALTEPQRLVIEAVAVLGDHATSSMLRVAIGHSGREEPGDPTAELARRDLLRRGAGDKWTLRHPLLRALVYENTAPRLRTEIHCRAADELARTGASAAERAHHVERSLNGWDPASAAVLSEAAVQFADTAPATAAHLLDVVLQMLPEAPEFDGQRGELTLSRAKALGISGNLRQSRDLLHALISVSGDGTPALRADAIALCAMMERHLGHSAEATALLRNELSRTPGPPPGQVVPLGLALGMSALLTVSYPDVRADIERTLAAARSQGDTTGEAGVLGLAALGEAYEGRTGDAERFADAAAGLVDGLTDPGLTDLCESLVWLAWAEALLERYAEAERHAERGLDIARRAGQLHVLPHLLMSKAYVHLSTCRLPSALEAAEEAESVARAIGSGDLLAFTLSTKTLIVLVGSPLGDHRALATAEEAVAAAGTGCNWWASLAWCMLGQAAYMAGDPYRTTEAILRAGGGPGLLRLQPSLRPAQLETLTNAAIATGDLDQAASWASRAAEEAAHIGLAGQRAAALRARAAIAEQRGDTSAAARLFHDAAQEHAHTGGLLWEVVSLLRAASPAKVTGHGPRADAMLRRAERVATGGGARLVSDLAELIRSQMEDPPHVPAEPAQLTARELEVAALVAEGLSNQNIATKLHLSRRTVETHLSTIYRKTSVPSRSALASLMTRIACDGRGWPTA
ncbi:MULTISPECIES: AAA family ATPase [unclassified Streptomyces]|uniref:ATP-binding protein n=1 Tax=unclassified Streptomyces TaxID=2593676 RepID=UPI001942E4EC|nr:MULTISPECIES: AAA family ATPase [unclassified Streptomyces]